MEIDTVGVFNMSRAAFPALKESGAGAIINISMTLHYGATWFQAHASAAKAAIDSLTRSVGGVGGWRLCLRCRGLERWKMETGACSVPWWHRQGGVDKGLRSADYSRHAWMWNFLLQVLPTTPRWTHPADIILASK